MREQGGGTVFSQVLERPKLSVKVPASTDIHENLRRLNNGGGFYTSYGGAGAKSMLGGSILAPTATQTGMQQVRFKGGAVGAMAQAQGQRHGYNNRTELREFSGVEQLKELRARLEPLLKRKASPLPPAPTVLPHPSHHEESVPPLLPQWGPGKRARRSRRNAFKVNGAAFPSKAIPLRSADEAASPLHTQGWCNATPASLESDGNPSKGPAQAAGRNGLNSKVAANGCTSTRQGITGAERALGSGVLTYKTEPSISLRQRSDSSAAEVPIASNGGNGHTTHVSRATAASETASLHANPRSELQALQWPRILIGLSRKEKEDDFLILKGTKLPQRPKKRPKVVERALHFCTPGNALCDLSRGRYDVREKKSVKKRPRGLKAMESVESDLE